MPGYQLLAVEPPQPQDLIIMVLGLYMRPAHDTVWSGGLVILLQELGFSPGAARIALARLVKRELMQRVRQGRLIFYALTARAEGVLAEGDRRILSLGRSAEPPDGWTTLIHQIPEERRLERQRLALRLRFLGFGSLQDGVWISPRQRGQEVAALLDELGIAEYAIVLVGQRHPSATYPLVERVWDLAALAERYHLFAKAFGRYAESSDRRGLSDKEAFVIRTMMVHLFRGFAFLDPDLPDKFMPDPIVRRRAVGIFHSVHDALAQPAQRHFDSAIGT